jgi:hypothetical protein
MVSEILAKTADGDNLDPDHLWLLQECINGNLNEDGETLVHEIHDQVMAGTYRKPWLCGVENLTRDQQGYVYWRGIRVEHYSFSGKDAYKRMKTAAEELARRCHILESKGIPVSCTTAVWHWNAEGRR